ncbi:hypothetical protein [uncultured Ilyobacter sp.]|uniref:hypothetical protein n=1 Tax=uncultured Ilyobacter sp. TaxID=544433 RepID=UPI0029C73630|nr:hypothetical protein [uncultured Ilyobacter sp.]
MNMISLEAMKGICYFYGVFSLVAQFSLSPEKTPTWLITVVSFFSVAIFTFIMLRFKEELNRRLDSIKMDRVIIMMVYLSIAVYGTSLLGRTYPKSVVYIQLFLGIGGIILDIIYAIFLKNLDAPLEKLEKVKSLRLYSNCILAAIFMIFTIVGIIFAVFLISLSYFILGNIFMEMSYLEDIEDLEEENLEN